MKRRTFCFLALHKKKEKKKLRVVLLSSLFDREKKNGVERNSNDKV